LIPTTYAQFHRRRKAKQLTALKIEKPEAVNFILGQTHFIKNVEMQAGRKIQNQEILVSRQASLENSPGSDVRFPWIASRNPPSFLLQSL